MAFNVANSYSLPALWTIPETKLRNQRKSYENADLVVCPPAFDKIIRSRSINLSLDEVIRHLATFLSRATVSSNENPSRFSK